MTMQTNESENTSTSNGSNGTRPEPDEHTAQAIALVRATLARPGGVSRSHDYDAANACLRALRSIVPLFLWMPAVERAQAYGLIGIGTEAVEAFAAEDFSRAAYVAATERERYLEETAEGRSDTLAGLAHIVALIAFEGSYELAIREIAELEPDRAGRDPSLTEVVAGQIEQHLGAER